MSEKIEKRYFKGREVFIPKHSNEDKEWNRIEIEKDKKYTLDIKDKYKKEFGKFTETAKKFGFEEILVNDEEEEKVYVPRLSPHIVVVPERYLPNYGTAQEFVPQNRLKEAMEALFFHERLHSIVEIGRDKNGTSAKITKEKRQLDKQFEELQARLEKTRGVKERLQLRIETQQLVEKHETLIKKNDEYTKEREIETNRQMMKETPNLDAIASLAIIQPILSDGVIGARFVFNEVKKLQRKESSFEITTQKMIEYFRPNFPHAAEKTLEKLTERFIKIGGEILEKFDTWEKKNPKNPKS